MKVIADYSEAGSEVAAAIRARGYEAAFFHVDVSSEPKVQAMVNKAVELWDRLDIMVANAGIGATGPAEQCGLHRHAHGDRESDR